MRFFRTMTRELRQGLADVTGERDILRGRLAGMIDERNQLIVNLDAEKANNDTHRESIKRLHKIRGERDAVRQEFADAKRANEFLSERIVALKTNFDSVNNKLTAVENALS